MESNSYLSLSIRLLLLMLATMAIGQDDSLMAADKPRVIVTSDGEIDDECSMVRFLLYANEFDIEGIIAGSDSANEASFVVPDEPGKQVHIILELTDSGTPPLVGYQRVVCNIQGN